MPEFLNTLPQIEKWLEGQKIADYQIVQSADQLVVNAKGFIQFQGLESIAVKFNRIEGSMSVRQCAISTLEFAPRIVTEHFSCPDNQLSSLLGAPEYVGGNFNCVCNKLTSLRWGPQTVVGYYKCDYNQLTTLEGSPKVIDSFFSCSDNQLKTLEYCPQIIQGNFYLECNPLETLEYFPQRVDGDIFTTQIPYLSHLHNKFLFESYWEFVQLERQRSALNAQVPRAHERSREYKV